MALVPADANYPDRSGAACAAVIEKLSDGSAVIWVGKDFPYGAHERVEFAAGAQHPLGTISGIVEHYDGEHCTLRDARCTPAQDLIQRAARAILMVPDERVLTTWACGYPMELPTLEEMPDDVKQALFETGRRILETIFGGAWAMECPNDQCDTTIIGATPETFHQAVREHVASEHKDELERTCPDCGCSNFNPCETIVGPCAWLPNGRCSACGDPRIRISGPQIETPADGRLIVPDSPRIVLP